MTKGNLAKLVEYLLCSGGGLMLGTFLGTFGGMFYGWYKYEANNKLENKTYVEYILKDSYVKDGAESGFYYGAPIGFVSGIRVARNKIKKNKK